MIKLVLVDIDGTLFQNEKPLWILENRIAQELGCFPVTREQHRLHWYKPTKQRLAQTYLGSDAGRFFDKLMEEYPEYAKNRLVDSISDENAQVLDELKRRRYELGILSSRTSIEMRHLLEGIYGLGRWFGPIYHADNLQYLKPDPRVFVRALAHSGVAAENAVYIGDLVSDGICATKAGLGFIAQLEEGILRREDFESAEPVFFAEKFGDILKYLK